MIRTISTPEGPMTVRATASAVAEIRFGSTTEEPAPVDPGASALLDRAECELMEYFAGRRHAFTFPIAPQGTPFQCRVWAALRTIPYGETRTYGQIAAQIGRPKACRAVGMANNRNPIAVVIPCHRVVGSGGSLTGYAAGLDVKAHLLALERR